MPTPPDTSALPAWLDEVLESIGITDGIDLVHCRPEEDGTYLIIIDYGEEQFEFHAGTDGTQHGVDYEGTIFDLTTPSQVQWYCAGELYALLQAAKRQRDEALETLDRLRQDLTDPPADVQEAVLDKLNLRSVITERDEARQQLARIAKEAFDDQDTIGLEPYADYVLRKLAEERALMQELRTALQSASRFVDCYTAETSGAIDDKWATARICDAALTKAKQMLP